MFLRQALGQRLPLLAAGAAAVDAQLAVRRYVLVVALDRHDVDRLRLVGVHRDREAEVRGQVAADLTPLAARVVGAHHVPVLLHEQRVRPGRVLREAVHAVADLRVLVRDLVRAQALVDGRPRDAGIVAAERPRGRDGHVDPVLVGRVQDDRVQAQAARARLPRRAGRVLAQPGQLLPLLAAVRRPVQRRVLAARVHRVRVVAGGLQVPDALELPRARRPVVPEMVARLALVGEVVAHGVPRLAAVVGTLHHLPEPATGLGGVEAVGVGRRPGDVVDLPPAEVRTVHGPVVAFAVCGQHERALTRADQYANIGHGSHPRTWVRHPHRNAPAFTYASTASEYMILNPPRGEYTRYRLTLHRTARALWSHVGRAHGSRCT